MIGAFHMMSGVRDDPVMMVVVAVLLLTVLVLVIALIYGVLGRK